MKTNHSNRKLALAVLCALAIIAGAARWKLAIGAPATFDIPTAPIPNPNGYDYFVRAGQAMILPAVLPSGDLSIEPPPVPRDPAQYARRYATAVKEKYVAANAPALHLLRQGLPLPYRAPQLVPGYSWSTPIYLFADLMRVLKVECHAREERGQWAAAAGSALDLVQFGADVARGGPMADAREGENYFEVNGRVPLWRILPHLNQKELRFVLARQQGIVDRHIGYAEIQQSDKWDELRYLLHILNSPTWPNVNDHLTFQQKWRLRTMDKQQAVNDRAALCDVLIANARLPYAAPQKPLPIPKDPLNEIVGTDFTSIRFVTTLNSAENDLLLTAMAVQTYRADHSRYPAQLSDLVPAYLRDIPADPFGAGGPLRYRLKADRYLLWSIGPDGKDSGGIPIEDKLYTTLMPRRWRVFSESKGDIVAGVNIE